MGAKRLFYLGLGGKGGVGMFLLFFFFLIVFVYIPRMRYLAIVYIAINTVLTRTMPVDVSRNLVARIVYEKWVDSFNYFVL